MTAVAADTHAALWFLENDNRLSLIAGGALDAAQRILLPSVCLVEITYLVEKGRLHEAVMPRILAIPPLPWNSPLSTSALSWPCKTFPATRFPTCPTASSPPPLCTTVCRSSPAIGKFGRAELTPFGDFVDKISI